MQDAAQTVRETRRWILSLPVSGEVALDHGAAKAGRRLGRLKRCCRWQVGVLGLNSGSTRCHKRLRKAVKGARWMCWPVFCHINASYIGLYTVDSR